jgi:hypothetical protein
MHGFFTSKGHIGRQAGERTDDEIAPRRPRMRQSQSRLVEPQTVEIYEIYVDGSRTIADSPYTAKRIFNGMHAPRKFVNLQTGVKDSQLVQELHAGKLGGHVNRSGLFYIALLPQAGLGHSTQHGNCPRKIFAPWLYVGT